MRHGQTDLHEIKVWDTGMIRARRHDRKPMTDQDWVTVQSWVEANRSVTVADALRIFGGRVLSPEEAWEIMAEDADWAAIMAERGSMEAERRHFGPGAGVGNDGEHQSRASAVAQQTT